MDRLGGELISSKGGREQRLTGVPLIIRAARSHAGPLMHVSWAHKACESVLELACARVGRTRRAYDHSRASPRPLRSDVNNVNGAEVKLICHAGPQ